MHFLRLWRTDRSRRVPPPAAPAAFASSARTHIGHVRALNEDRTLDHPERRLWAVADGMGGHEGGDVAAATTIRKLFDASGSEGKALSSEIIAAAIAEANAEIFGSAKRRRTLSGSTVAGLWIDGGRYCVFWVGDSRVYRYSGGRMALLTRDHSLVQTLVDSGALSNEAARTHPASNVITRAIGIEADVQVEMVRGILRPGDRFLLCSDGLSSVVGEDRLRSAFESETLEQMSTDLLGAALAAGGPDNISVVAVGSSD